MNRIFRLVWNEEHQDCVPAPETARRRNKRSSKKAGKVIQAAASVLLGLFLTQPVWAQSPIGPNTLPTGGEVIHGQASISQNANQMHINQGSDKVILHWQGFDIGRDAHVDFAQPSSSSVALIRVVAGEASQIHGQLTANAQVWLINPRGVVFGQGSKVDVGGLVTSTLDTTNEDFLAGKMNFFRGQATGSITNQGEIIAAEGGLVALLAPEIINDGLVSAQMGTVIMAGGDRISLDAGMNGMLKVAVDASTVNSLIENRQMVKADGGQVIMTSKAATELVSSVITNKGTIQARTMVERNGRILLLADMDHGEVHQAGILDASAPISGDGGFVETSAATVKVTDGSQVTTKSETGRTGTWIIDPNDFTIAASGGDISGTQLSIDLSNNDVEILSTAGSDPTGEGDIHVNDAVNWSANKLTLTAERDIHINAVMTASGSSKLEMNTGNEGDVKVGFKEGEAQGFAGRVDFDRSGTGFLKINNQDYTVINSLGEQGSTSTTDLQGMQGGLSGYYALGGDIAASATAGWNKNDGFAPIGTSTSKAFTGAFNGLGHVVSGLTINRSTTDRIGLFGYSTGKISNVGLQDGNITGKMYVGGLVGYNNEGQIGNSYATGAVTGNNYYAGGLVGYNSGTDSQIANSYATGNVNVEVDAKRIIGVGGLVGSNNLGQITHSYATGAVTAKVNSPTSTSHYAEKVGGLVGINNEGQITHSYATGAVTADEMVGGLAGGNYDGQITNCYATGAVTGNYVGGLVGDNNQWSSSSQISNCYATGAVTGNDWYAGGLVGTNNAGQISDSYATGAVTGEDWVGGLVGINCNGYDKQNKPIVGQITQSYATGAVTGNEGVGGLVGTNNAGQISDSYATGAVTGEDWVGGLVGSNNADDGQISYSYATGTVEGQEYVGGLVGYSSGQITSSFWNTDTCETSADGEGKTTAEMKSLDIFVGWSISNQSDQETIWRIYEDHTYPLLSFFLTPVSEVTVNNDSKTYDGIAYTYPPQNGLSGFTGDMDHVFYGGSAQGAINADTYTIAIYSDQQGYDFIGNPTGTLTINKAQLSTSLIGDVTKTYDGSNEATLASNNYAITGWIGSEGGTITQTSGSYDNADADTGKTVTVSLGTDDYSPESGTRLANYNLPTTASGSVGIINQAGLTITARDYGKTYDGLAYSGGNDVDYSGFVGSEDKTVLGGTLGYSGTSQGAKYAGSYIITPKGYTATNYILTYVDGQLVIQGGPGTQQASPASGSLLPATNPQSEVQNTVPQGIQLIGNSNMAQDATLLLSVASDSVSSVAPDSVSSDAPDSVSSDVSDSDSLEGEEKDEE